jgi:hypothetical protein
MDAPKVRIPLLKEGEKPSSLYWLALKKAIKSDGCTKVPDAGTGPCCIGHDLRYKFGIDEYGKPCKKSCADAFLRKCIEKQSFLHRFSVLAKIYWLGVKEFGAWAYAGDVDSRPEFEIYYWTAEI